MMRDARIDEFIDRFDPAIAVDVRSAREKMRQIVGSGFELVFDNYNALVFGFSPTEKSIGAVLSIAVYPRWLTLFFLFGASLDDPHRLLEGSGKQVRGIRLGSPADLDRPEVRKLISQAMGDRFDGAPSLTTIVKSVSAKQRSRV